MTAPATKPPFADLDLAPPGVHVERRQDGSFVLRSHMALEAYPKSIGAVLRANAAKFPERPFLAERTGGPGSPWRTLRYGEVAQSVRRLAQAFLDLGLNAQRPVMLLSDNAIDHALVQLAAAVRVFLPLAAPAATLAAIQFSGSLWCAAFGLFAAKFWPILTQARPDGRPG